MHKIFQLRLYKSGVDMVNKFYIYAGAISVDIGKTSDKIFKIVVDMPLLNLIISIGYQCLVIYIISGHS